MSDSEPTTPLEELPLAEHISRLVRAQIALAGYRPVDVESAIAGSYLNDIPVGALQTDLGTNVAPGDAALDVTP